MILALRSEPTGLRTNRCFRIRNESIMTMFIFILLVILVPSIIAVVAALLINLTINLVRTAVRTDTNTDTNTDANTDTNTDTNTDIGTECTIAISDLPIHEQVADEMLLASCDTSDMTCVVVGSTPLNHNDYTTVPTSVALAVHAGDTWLTGVVAQVTGLAHTIDAIVEEYYDRVQWMINIMKKGGDE